MTDNVGAPPRFTLQRLDYTEHATFGQLFDAENREIAKTLELPWRYNHVDTSCIPTGTYRCFRRKSPKRGYWLYELISVPGRKNIQIHIANRTDQLLGCIAVGRHFGDSEGVKGVVDSADAFRDWMRATRSAEYITLDVKAPVVHETLGDPEE